MHLTDNRFPTSPPMRTLQEVLYAAASHRTDKFTVRDKMFLLNQSNRLILVVFIYFMVQKTFLLGAEQCAPAFYTRNDVAANLSACIRTNLTKPQWSFACATRCHKNSEVSVYPAESNYKTETVAPFSFNLRSTPVLLTVYSLQLINL